MKANTIHPTIVSYRPVFGFLAGVIVWLVLAIYFKKPFGLSPLISLLLSIKISGLSEPKQTTILGAALGLVLGIFAGAQYYFQSMGNVNNPFLLLIGMVFGIGVGIIIFIPYVAILGFVIGNLLELYKKGNVVF